eukprot:s5298_g2.t3
MQWILLISQPQPVVELGQAMVPGAARSVAGKLAEEWQRGRADAAVELRNWDRTEQEIAGKEGDRQPLTVLLSDLSPQEVGCLLRTCEAAGVPEVVLCDDTPGPPDPGVLKTSLQAEDFLCIRRAADAAGELQRLASAGMQVWTLDSDSGNSAKQPEADLFEDFAPCPPVALGLGCRIAGFPRIRVPVRHAAGADIRLSIGVIGSVVIYDLIRRLRKIPKAGKTKILAKKDAKYVLTVQFQPHGVLAQVMPFIEFVILATGGLLSSGAPKGAQVRGL